MRFQVVLSLLLVTACIPIPIPINAIAEATAGPPTPWPATAQCPVPARSATDSAQLLALINAERAKAGVAPVSLSAVVSTMAHKHACDNAATQSISHVGSDGSTLSERLRREGIRVRHAAENTGLGFATPQAALAFWMGSPGHRANILAPEATQVGIGQADGARRPTWVVNFIRPK